MKRILIILALLCHTTRAEQSLYIAVGDEIAVFSVDLDSASVKPKQNLALAGSGPFVFSKDGTRMYAMASDRENPELATLERASDGTLNLLNQAAINLRGGFVDLDATGNYIATNHYGEGKVSVWKLDEGIYRGDVVCELNLEPRAHGANFSADNRWLLVPATAPNKVFINRFDAETGQAVPHDPPFALALEDEQFARHPRHLQFHPHIPTVAYTTCESTEPGISVWSWDTETGTLEMRQNIVTRPEGFEGKFSTSTLRVTPNGRFLYVSNRQKDGYSSIVGFQIDEETGFLNLIGHTPCETVPRAFCLDQTGNLLFVGGQIDNLLGVYRIDQETGTLTKTEQHEIGNRPMWLATQ